VVKTAEPGTERPDDHLGVRSQMTAGNVQRIEEHADGGTASSCAHLFALN